MTGFDGASFGAQDLDGQGANRQQVVTFDALALEGAPAVSVSMALAEDAVSDAHSWDSPDFFHADYSLDGNGFQPLLHVEAEGGSGTTNAPARIDDDFDGIGEGSVLTDVAQIFTRGVNTDGASSLVLRLTFDLNSREQDIAVDDIVVMAMNGPLPVELSAFDAARRATDIGLA